jgi:hypothetical protein
MDQVKRRLCSVVIIGGSSLAGSLVGWMTMFHQVPKLQSTSVPYKVPSVANYGHCHYASGPPRQHGIGANQRFAPAEPQ